jgi:hypothetical protein
MSIATKSFKLAGHESPWPWLNGSSRLPSEMKVSRIEPTIGPNLTSDKLPENSLHAPKLPPSKVAIRRSNQRKVAISSAILFVIVVGTVGVLLSGQPTINAAAVSYRLGEAISFALITTTLALGLTFFGRKPWTWGFTVFLLIALLVPIFKLAS